MTSLNLSPTKNSYIKCREYVQISSYNRNTEIIKKVYCNIGNVQECNHI